MDINELYFIGSNAYGQSGAGNIHKNKQYQSPIPILFPIFIKQVSCGYHHSALLTIDGNVYTMGSNIHGTLAQSPSDINYSFSPILVPNLKEVTKIASGAFHLCAIKQGSLYTWGKGIDGQLGTGNYSNCYKPTKVSSLGNDVEDVSCGQNHTLVKSSSECFSFGNGIFGQLGINSNKNSHSPVRVHLFNVEEIAAGENHSLFVSEGQVYGCGENKFGETGTGLAKKYVLEPKPTGLKNVATIKAGKISAAVTNNGELFLWGSFDKRCPTNFLQFDEGVMDIRIGNERAYCLTSKGELFEVKLSQKKEGAEIQKINVETSAILDFSIGESHSLILGDIVTQTPYAENTFQTLKNMNSYSTQKYSPNESHSQSISSEHCPRTPSSIFKQSSNFLKQEKRNQVKVNQFCQQEVNKNMEVEIMGKVEKIMKMLEKSSKIENQQTGEYCLRKMSYDRLANTNKENSISISNEETSRNNNRKLIMQLRRKELRISELQDQLSRKQMQVESQRELIKLLTQLNNKQF